MTLVCVFAGAPAQLAVLGALVGILGGLFLSYLDQEEARDHRRNVVLERLAVPLTLAPEHDLYTQYLAFCKTLTDLANQTDPLPPRDRSPQTRFGELADRVVSPWDGRVRRNRDVAGSLRSAPRRHRSPGIPVGGVGPEQGLLAGCPRPAEHEGQLRGGPSRGAGRADRHPPGRPVAARPERCQRTTSCLGSRSRTTTGCDITLVRESDLASEPDLLADIGVYGDRACGTQELDERSRTVRFVLYFDRQAVRLAKDRWRRLAIYVVPPLEHTTGSGSATIGRIGIGESLAWGAGPWASYSTSTRHGWAG
jgi:hypothetical protein